MFVAALLAGGAVCAYNYSDDITSLTDKFNWSQSDSQFDVRPAPAQIADYFLNKVVMDYKRDRGLPLYMPADQREAIRDAIIQYESFEIKTGDLKQYFDFPPEDAHFLDLRLDFHMRAGKPEAEAVVLALQDLQVSEISRLGRDGGLRPERESIEAMIRNRKYIEKYGHITLDEARELRENSNIAYGKKSLEWIQENCTRLEYLTSGQDLPHFWAARLGVHLAAARDIANGTFKPLPAPTPVPGS